MVANPVTAPLHDLVLTDPRHQRIERRVTRLNVIWTYRRATGWTQAATAATK